MNETKIVHHSPLAVWLDKTGHEQAWTGLAELMPGAAVFVVDADRNIIFWSTGASELLGFSEKEVVGQHCRKSNRCHQCMMGCGIEEYGSVDNVSLKLFKENGEVVPVRKTGRAFFDEHGSFTGGIEVLVRDDAPRETAGSSRAEDITVFHDMAARDPGMLRIFETVRHIGETEATVLVRGESGTGKDLVARAIHLESGRREGPFVSVNCAAFTPSLFESELFGHVKGSFTGAVKDRIGLLQRADKGTLFLDEIAELPMDLQAKLLRVLEDGEFVQVGGSKPSRTDVRVISATNHSLREAVQAGRFREDLMFRLRVVPLFLPPLRERRIDIEPLLWRFIALHNTRGLRHVTSIKPEAMRALLDHAWPGNVRELKNVIEYAFAVGRSHAVEIEDLPPELRETNLEITGTLIHSRSLNDEEKTLREALRIARGNIGQAAEILGMSRPTFWRKRKKYGL